MKNVFLLSLLISSSLFCFSQKNENNLNLEDGWYEAVTSSLDSRGAYSSPALNVYSKEWVFVHDMRITSIGRDNKAKNEFEALRLDPKYITGGIVTRKKTGVYKAEIIFKKSDNLQKTLFYEIKI